jgi:D-ribulokinase
LLLNRLELKVIMDSGYYLGIDFGTSGARAVAIDGGENWVFTTKLSFPSSSIEGWATIWRETLFGLIQEIPPAIRSKIERIAIDGTSSTVLLCDRAGNSLDEPIFYHDDRGKKFLPLISSITPPNHVVNSSTSSLAKLFWWSQQEYFPLAGYFLHQADWLAFLLHGQLGISDYHNALKLGYDVENLCYPAWLRDLAFFPLCPCVVAPGEIIGKIDREVSHRYGLPENCLICGGTTDSIAAFLASGASNFGTAVTSLGSTLVLKLLSQTRVEAAHYGIYSHRLGNFWLTGGASNVGGAILQHFFRPQELVDYSAKIDLTKESHLDYYPLLKKGERFPLNDPELAPKIAPIPLDRVEFLYGLFSSLARIEALGYRKLTELGATPATQIYTAGGGANNPTWQSIRQRYCQVPISIAKETEAAYGVALLAKGINLTQIK